MTKFTDADALDKLLKNVKGNGRPFDGKGEESKLEGEGGDGEGEGEEKGEGEGKGPGEGEGGDDPTEGKSWAEMVEEEFPEGKRLIENIKGMAEMLRKLLEEMAEEQGGERVHSLMFVLELAVETLYADFYAGVYTEVPEVMEEDVLRLRRMVREMGGEFTR